MMEYYILWDCYLVDNYFNSNGYDILQKITIFYKITLQQNSNPIPIALRGAIGESERVMREKMRAACPACCVRRNTH